MTPAELDTGPPEKRAAPVGYRGVAKLSNGIGRHFDIYSRPAHPSRASLRPAFELRPYQAEAVEAIIKGFGEFRRQLRVCPTGGGKTIEFAALAAHYLPRKTLILAHREELLEQARDKILRATGIVAEIEAAERYASLDAPIVVASIPSLHEQRRRRFPSDHFALIVADEAHHALAESWQNVLGYFEDARILGVTATPDRGDKRLLGDYFENVAHETTLIDLISAGYLCRIRVKTIPLQIDLRDVHTVAGDFDEHEVGHALEPHLAAIADIIAKDFAGRKSLAFLPLCSLSERFAALCRERGIAAEHVDGKSNDRSGVLERFRNGETRLVSNAMLWSEGFDEPSIDCIIPLRPTRIRSLYAQQIGRGTRIHPGKDFLQVIDFLWLTHHHDLVRAPVLVAKDEKEASGASGDGDLIENIERFRADRLGKLARALESTRDRKGREFDLIDFAIALGDEDIARFEPTMRWHSDPATLRQGEFLTRCGIDPAALRSKGHAASIIDRLAKRRAAGLATFKQVRTLRKFGVSDAHTISFTRAHEILDRLFSERLGRGTRT